MLTVNEVAEQLSVHPQTVYRWIDRGHLTAIRLVGSVRVEEEALAQFIERQKKAREQRGGGKAA